MQGLPKAAFPEISFRNKYPVFKHRNSWSPSKETQTSNQKWNSKKPGSLADKEKSLEIFDRFFSSESFLMALLHWPLLGSLGSSSCEPRQTYEEAGQRLNIWQNGKKQTWWNLLILKRTEESPRKGKSELGEGRKKTWEKIKEIIPMFEKPFVVMQLNITLPTKVCTVKGMFFFFFNQRPIFLTHIGLSLVIKAVVFPVVMCGCESCGP